METTGNIEKCLKCGHEWTHQDDRCPECGSQETDVIHVGLRIDKVRPKKICYCGSLRKALDEFKRAEYEAVLNGNIALLPCCMFIDIEREYGAESDYKIKADELHKRKIDICDEVVILNVSGYIGSSTQSELDYALSIGKPVRFLEPIT